MEYDEKYWKDFLDEEERKGKQFEREINRKFNKHKKLGQVWELLGMKERPLSNGAKYLMDKGII